MNNNMKYLRSYFPWFFVLFAFDLFIAILLWLSDVRAFQALFVLLILTTAILFFAISIVLAAKERKKVDAYRTFISNPDKRTEIELLRLCNVFEKEMVKDVAEALYTKQTEIENVSSLLSEYEEFVETWAHEIKLPLSLLNLVLDNQSDNLPKDIQYKLDYVRNQIQGNVSQILFYYRVKGDKKDFLFENVDLKECIQDVLEDFKPLLEEKNFRVHVENIKGTTYTDYRSFEFILSQMIGNAVKYSAENPELYISMKEENTGNVLFIVDNGCGVKACDLPHIFEKGFTGDSGDTRKKSTGIGLYLVKQLADDLNINLEVKSDWMKGFEVALYI